MQPLSMHKRDQHVDLDRIANWRTYTHTSSTCIEGTYTHTHQTHASKVPNLLLDMKLRLPLEHLPVLPVTPGCKCSISHLQSTHWPCSQVAQTLAQTNIFQTDIFQTATYFYISPRVTNIVTVLAQIQSFWCRDPTAALHIDGTEIHINGPHCPL